MFSFNSIRWAIRRYPAYILGRTPRLHRIPFGVLRGLKIFMSWDISPRMWVGIGEPWIARLAEAHVPAGGAVYDIGAHVGYTTLIFARRVGPSGAVHSFEILPSVAEGFLRKTVEGNHLSQVTIHVVGVAGTAATLDLTVGRTMMASLDPTRVETGRGVQRCTVVRLDDYRLAEGLPLPAFIKMDIEGAEVDALEGARETIRAARPVMAVEFHSLDLLRRGLPILEGLGYRCETRHGPLTRPDVERLTEFHESVLCLPA